MTFWSRAASRQQQHRKNSERENRRLRMVVSLYTRRAKQLERSWHKRMGTAELSRAINPRGHPTEPRNEAVPRDSPVVLARLMVEVEQVYTGIDDFLARRRQQQQQHQKEEKVLFAHSDSVNVPFDRHTVEQVVWSVIGYRVTRNPANFHRDDIRASEDSMSSSAHMTIGQKGNGVYVQMRVAGRKYREEGRTVIVLRALVEPKDFETRASLGIMFQETHVRVVTSAGTTPPLCPSQLITSNAAMETHVVVTQHLPSDWSKPLWQSYPNDHITRSMWKRAIDSRSQSIEDMLFEQARQAGAAPE